MNNEFSQDFYLGYFEAKAVFRAFFAKNRCDSSNVQLFNAQR